MSFELKLAIYRYILVAFGALFLSHGASACNTYFVRKYEIAKHQIVMNFTCFLYCVGLFIYSFQFLTGYLADLFANLQWFIAGFALTSYLTIISDFFPDNRKVYTVGKYIIYSLLFLFVLDTMELIDLYKFRADSYEGIEPVFLNSLMDLTTLGYIPAAAMALNTLAMNVFTLKVFLKRKSKERLIFFGVFATLLAITNDILISIFPDSGLFPLFYIGSMFETVRFSQVIKEKARKQLEDLRIQNKLNETELEEARFSEILLRALCHDINNGLSIAQYGSEKLTEVINSKGPVDDKTLKFAAEKVEAGVSNIENIRSYIMDLQKVKSLNKRVNISSFTLEAPLGRLISNYFLSAKRKDITIKPVGEFSQRISSDKQILENHILPNLLSNAVKFSKPGSTIYIEESFVKNKYRLSFTNSGNPIPEKTLESIKSNEIVQSSYGTQGEKGHGFGFFIVKKMLEVLNVELDIENKEPSLVSVSIEFKLEELVIAGR